MGCGAGWGWSGRSRVSWGWSCGIRAGSSYSIIATDWNPGPAPYRQHGTAADWKHNGAADRFNGFGKLESQLES
jgi:hypothetical protein